MDFVLYRDADRFKQPLHYNLAADAAGWLFFDGIEPTDPQGKYTFLHLCALLDLNPTRLREQALMLNKDDLARFNGDTTL